MEESKVEEKRGSDIPMGLNRTPTDSLNQASSPVMSSNGFDSQRIRPKSGHLVADERSARESEKAAVDDGGKEGSGSSSSSGEGSDNDRQGVNIEKRRIKLMKYLENKKKMKDYKIDNNEAYQVFVDKHTSRVKDCMINNGNEKEKTLIHYLANRKDLKSKLHKAPFTFLIRLILKIDDDQYRSTSPSSNYERIFCVRSAFKHGAYAYLHTALSQSQVKFVKYICEMAEPSVLGQAIATPNSGGRTVLYLAIIDASPPDLELIRLLTEKARADTFVTIRGKISDNHEGEGNTPLHDFVNFEMSRLAAIGACSNSEHQYMESKEDAKTNKDEDYMAILKTMVKYGPAAIAKLNKASESPYLFHTSTRSKVKHGKPEWLDLELVGPLTLKTTTVGVEEKGGEQRLRKHMTNNKTITL